MPARLRRETLVMPARLCRGTPAMPARLCRGTPAMPARNLEFSCHFVAATCHRHCHHQNQCHHHNLHMHKQHTKVISFHIVTHGSCSQGVDVHMSLHHGNSYKVRWAYHTMGNPKGRLNFLNLRHPESHFCISSVVLINRVYSVSSPSKHWNTPRITYFTWF